MAGEEEIKRGAATIGDEISQAAGAEVGKLSREALEEQLLPKNVLGMSDSMVEGIYGQAYRMYNTGKYNDAVQLFRLLIMLNATEPKYVMGLAACFHMLKDYDSAMKTYSLCGVIDPESPIPHYHISDCFIQLKDPVSAIVALEMAIERSKNKDEYHALKDRAQMTIDSLRKEMDEKQGKAVKKKKKKRVNNYD